MSQINISPVERIRQHATFKKDAVGAIYEGTNYTYADIYSEARHFATGLLDYGVQAGDRVAYMGVNSLNFMVVLLGCAWVGAVYVPLNFRLAAEEVANQLHDFEPKIVVVEPGHAAIFDSISHDISTHPLLVDNDAALAAYENAPEHWNSLSEFMAGTTRVEPVVLLEDDVAMLLYTSGTTGRPKGAVLTHGNLWWNAVNVDSVVDTRSTDVNLAVAPLFHIGGLNAFTLRAFTSGATTIIRRSVDAEQTVKDLVDYKVTTMFAVPAMLAALTRVPGFASADLSNLRSTVAAGAPVPTALISEFLGRGIAIQQAWGLTETAPFATYLPAALTRTKNGSAGIPMPFTQVKLVDTASGEDVTVADLRGELWVKGPNVIREYWRNEKANADAFVRGWFRTGDIGYLDDDGFLFIVDRLKDMIITGGENVYPAEVERVLSGHPALADNAVIGVADEKWGESVTAVVVMAGAGDLTLQDVRDFVALHLARYKLPTRLHIVESMPRNGAGKLDKLAIRRLVAELTPEANHV
ncbi:fatty-acid--CoA ligase [Cryobacterium frigoriphilum]|uniref:Fatty-acid--CoA ligase n=1 Tax=Cryobacterium frigoriphilum TaxID=1259150 RepID=A0A4R9A4V3_9MICO|nr:AMP-binding protein [Cryobacterium frigoriphilum]TFD52281.1 fatty-acid--CoA ligase [Cryobacterium frigoriphilum]